MGASKQLISPETRRLLCVGYTCRRLNKTGRFQIFNLINSRGTAGVIRIDMLTRLQYLDTKSDWNIQKLEACIDEMMKLGITTLSIKGGVRLNSSWELLIEKYQIQEVKLDRKVPRNLTRNTLYLPKY